MQLRTSVLACFALLSFASVASAQPLRAHGSLGTGRALTGHQKDEYAWGAGASVGLEYAFLRQLGLELQGSWLALGDGDPPSDAARFVDADGASAFAAVLGLHVVPLAASHNGKLFSPAGLWTSVAGGATFTNDLTRPTLDAKLGYDLLSTSGKVGAGPMLSFVHVWQPDSEFRPADANVLLFGVHAMYDFDTPKTRGDRDKDGIFDDIDRCPDTPEDKDGFQDTDGCPDLDNDADTIPDVTDKCPNVPEDRDRFEDEDGCPELDNDKDGLLDRVDQCPNEPEDNDGWESLDGCPEPDNDKDRIPDKDDKCPNEPETYNGFEDEDGCPDRGRVVVTETSIEILDVIYFEYNSAKIQSRSFPILDAVAATLQGNPGIQLIEIQGHTDERGDDAYNLDLSDRRSKSVMQYLVDKGVDAKRLTAQGYGETQPLDRGHNEKAWAKNRRVAFLIIKRASE
jgi:outer membrane protein OmpA-like peptidoglycan-associated protein